MKWLEKNPAAFNFDQKDGVESFPSASMGRQNNVIDT